MHVPSLDIDGKGNGVLQRMLSSVRKEKIKKTLLEKKEVSVSELAETFSVSDETIRRDLRVLEEEGFARRSHGGATLSNRVKSTVDNSALAGLFVESKRIIAAQCERFIRDGDCIFLDGSTTASAICERIQQKEITVLTNSLRAEQIQNDQADLRGRQRSQLAPELCRSVRHRHAESVLCGYGVHILPLAEHGKRDH